MDTEVLSAVEKEHPAALFLQHFACINKHFFH